MKIVEQSIELLSVTKDPEEMIELAGRTCYRSEPTPGSAPAFVRRLRKLGHDAMIEHASASFKIVTNRAIANEIVRHRIASYAQTSTRFCSYEAGITVIRPPGMMLFAQEQIWLRACYAAEKSYLALFEAGTSPQIARDVLPLCLKAELVMAANFREWLHFIKLRMSKTEELQSMPSGDAILYSLKEIAPAVFRESGESK